MRGCYSKALWPVKADSVMRAICKSNSANDLDPLRPTRNLVMPNHVHALVQPLENHSLDLILHSWKSFSANQINKMSGSRGRLWHPESFDHIVRSAAQLKRFEKYIRDNPKSLSFNECADTE